MEKVAPDGTPPRIEPLDVQRIRRAFSATPLILSSPTEGELHDVAQQMRQAHAEQEDRILALCEWRLAQERGR